MILVIPRKRQTSTTRHIVIADPPPAINTPKRLRIRQGVPRRIPPGRLVAVDTETTGLHPWHGDRPFAVSFCDENGVRGYFEWPVDPVTREVKYDKKEARLIREWLESNATDKVWFHGKFDRRMLAFAFNVRHFGGEQREVMFAAHVCNSSEKRIALKPLSVVYLEISNEDEKDLQKATATARRIGKKHGATLAVDRANGKNALKADYWMVSVFLPEEAHLVRQYAVEDAVRTMLLWQMYVQVMDEMGESGWPQYRMEKELEPVVEGMEDRGVHYSREENNRLLGECEEELRDSLVELRQLSGRPNFDPKKPNDVRELLYEIGDERGTLPIGMMTKGGKRTPPQPSTAFKYVQLHKDRTMVKTLLRYKASLKGTTTYFRTFDRLALPDPICPGELHCHSQYNQVRAKTGRFSSSGAGNFQNVPEGISGRAGRTVRGRDIFGARPGFTWYLYDFSQVEVRIFADLSQDQFLLENLAKGRDIHTESALKAWGNERGVLDTRGTLGLSGALVNEHNLHEYPKLQQLHKTLDLKPSMLFGKLPVHAQEKIAREWLESFGWHIVKAEESIDMKSTRNKAKILLFCRIFGGGPNAVKDLLYVSYEEAKRFLGDYSSTFPRIAEFLTENEILALHQGYVETEFGRRLMVPADKAYRATNYRVQGSAAGLMKRALLAVDKVFKDRDADAHLLLTIHDELCFEVNNAQRSKGLLRDVKRAMEDHGGAFNIPMPTEASRTEHRWTDKKKLDWLNHETSEPMPARLILENKRTIIKVRKILKA